MEQQEFDANEVIGGFPLPQIRRAVSQVGLHIFNERDDVTAVAAELGCPRHQARRVLVALEKHGFVVSTTTPERWEKTTKDYRLAWEWRPPRKFTPIIDRGSEPRCGQGFESIPCGIVRTLGDEETVLEEAALDVVIHRQYDGDRMIELSVMQPDDLEDLSGSAFEAIVTYITPRDAKRLMKTLQDAIFAAELELEGRNVKRTEDAKVNKARESRAR